MHNKQNKTKQQQNQSIPLSTSPFMLIEQEIEQNKKPNKVEGCSKIIYMHDAASVYYIKSQGFGSFGYLSKRQEMVGYVLYCEKQHNVYEPRNDYPPNVI